MARSKALRPFMGVDGEGGKWHDGRHEYLLLRAGDDILHTGQPLDWWDCFNFLATLKPGYEHVAYFFNYDVTMMCKELPAEVIRDLLDREAREKPDGRGHYPVSFKGFQFDYVPNKEFRVRRTPFQRGPIPPWTVVSDVGTFFQTSFLKAIQTWGIGTQHEWDLIEEGKLHRAQFGTMTDEIVKYNGLEIELLEDLMETFRGVCVELGIVPKRWQGPGNMASAMFERYGIPKHDELYIPDDVWRFAQAAYYGGRFETTAVGPVGVK